MLGAPVETQDRPIDRRRAATRSEILDVAWQICRDHGLASLSLRDLAARVGMRAPSLYSYFRSKEAIYDAMFAQGQLEMRAALGSLPERDLTREDFRAMAHGFFDFCTADPVRYQLLFQRTVPGFEPSADSYALAVEMLEELTQRMAAVGVTDPRMVDLWTALLTGLTDQQISNDPGGDRWGRLLDDAVDLFCDHAGVPRAPARAPRRRR